MSAIPAPSTTQASPNARGLRIYAMSKPRHKRRATHYRRRASMANDLCVAEPETAVMAERLMQFWNEHAIKTGVMLFMGWFGVANWTSLQVLLR